jgi:hypothetical protein
MTRTPRAGASGAAHATHAPTDPIRANCGTVVRRRENCGESGVKRASPCRICEPHPGARSEQPRSKSRPAEKEPAADAGARVQPPGTRAAPALRRPGLGLHARRGVTRVPAPNECPPGPSGPPRAPASPRSPDRTRVERTARYSDIEHGFNPTTGLCVVQEKMRCRVLGLTPQNTREFARTRAWCYRHVRQSGT